MSESLAPRPSAFYPIHVPSPVEAEVEYRIGHLSAHAVYEIFGSVIEAWLNPLGRDPQSGIIRLVAESACRFHNEIRPSRELITGLRVDRVGRSSVTYTLAIFANGGEDPGSLEPLATCRWVDVYVTRAPRRPVGIPAQLRSRLLTARLQ